MKLRLRKPSSVINTKVLADILFQEDNRTKLFLELTPKRRLELLRSVTPQVKKDILMHLPGQDLIDVLESVDPDEATDILQLLDRRKREAIISRLTPDLKEEVTKLLQFDAETAAGLMTLDFITVEVNERIASVSKKFKEFERRTGRPPVILALKKGKLLGFLPGHELGFGARTELIGRYVKRLPSISSNADHDDVIQLFRSQPDSKAAVLSDNGDVEGVIYSDDVLTLAQEQESSSLAEFAGVSDEEAVSDPTRSKVNYRYRWLIINLATAFLAAFSVSLFQDTLNKFVLLAIYMPVVAGMGGNAATQTLAVVVRGIALRQIDLKTALHTLKNELGAGFINGLINGAIAAVVVVAITHNVKFAFVLALAMVINLVVAALFGTMVPLIMYNLGKDPAASATIFITTATDVIGFLTFLGLGTLILG